MGRLKGQCWLWSKAGSWSGRGVGGLGRNMEEPGQLPIVQPPAGEGAPATREPLHMSGPWGCIQGAKALCQVPVALRVQAAFSFPLSLGSSCKFSAKSFICC